MDRWVGELGEGNMGVVIVWRKWVDERILCLRIREEERIRETDHTPTIPSLLSSKFIQGAYFKKWW